MQKKKIILATEYRKRGRKHGYTVHLAPYNCPNHKVLTIAVDVW
nr:MAG TPA: hypothetical protein [Caudoviricetes sp.]